MESIKIYYNGFRIGDSKELVKAHIGCGDNYVDHKESVTIYGVNYNDLPRGYGFGVSNDSDSMTDYFCNDSARVFPEHPLYKYLRYAALKARCQDNKRILKSRYYNEQEKEKARQAIADFEKLPNPGQPTAEDMEALKKWIKEREDARIAAEKAEREREEEERANKAMIEKLETEITINQWTEKYPIVEGRATVKIEWSERLGIEDNSVWSFRAAQFIFRDLDMREHALKRGYDKTKFLIEWDDEQGHNTYEGRYDIGDGEGGLMEHIYNFGEYYRTHNEFGHELENPPETNECLEMFKRIVKSA